MGAAARRGINYEAGLEVVTPTACPGDPGLSPAAGGDVRHLHEELERHGEGLFAIVFQVGDGLSDAVDRAIKLGVRPGVRFTMPEEDREVRFERFEQVEVGRVSSVYWWLSHVVPAAGVED